MVGDGGAVEADDAEVRGEGFVVVKDVETDGAEGTGVVFEDAGGAETAVRSSVTDIEDEGIG